MNKNIRIALGVIILVGAGFFVYQSTRQSTSNEAVVVDVSPVEENMMDDTKDEMANGEMMSYTLEDVAQHATAEDCWFAINGTVYDVTSYIADAKHPGGPAILEGCGKDATTLFEGEEGPRNEPHSENAHSYLLNFEIGKLAL